MARLRREARRRDAEGGTAAVEFIGALPWMILAALVAWQLLLVGAATSAAENAARNGSRAASMGGQAHAAAVDSLPGWLQDGSTVNVGGTRVRVALEVPIVAPILRSSRFVIERAAEFPP